MRQRFASGREAARGADDHGCVCDGMAAPGYGCVPSCPCEYEVEDRDRCHIDAPAMRFGWCWVVFLHNDASAGARRQPCQQSKIMAQKWLQPLAALIPTDGRVRKLQNQGQTLRKKLNSFGFIETTISEAIGAACRPPPQRLPTPAPGASEAISETLLKRHARARPWQRATTPWRTARTVMMMNRHRCVRSGRKKTRGGGCAALCC